MPQYDLAASIVTYNADFNELLPLLKSIQSAKLRILLTVVDNSPMDALRHYVEGTGARYLFPGANVGFGAGHNIALQSSLNLAPYQAVINPDILLDGAVLEELVTFMQRPHHQDVGQLMPAIVYPDGSEQRLAKRLPTPADLLLRRFSGFLNMRQARSAKARYEMQDVDMTMAREVPCLSGCFMILRSSVLQQVGLFDERYFMYMEDFDLCRRIGMISRTVFYPFVRVTHGYSKGSYRDRRLFFYHLRSAFLYFTKWGWVWDRVRLERNHRDSIILALHDSASEELHQEAASREVLV